MNDSQLPLFDWPTSVMAEGYRNLSALKFEQAEQQFMEVLHTGQGEKEEITKALQACAYWQDLVEQNRRKPDACSTSKFHENLRRYEFGNIPGLHQLKRALLEYLAGRMISDNSFYLNSWDGETVSDLLTELRHYKKAEKVVLRRIEKQPDDAQLWYSLAQIQWLNEYKGEARKNYARGLLRDPCRVPSHRILYEPLNSLIGDVGAELAPAFGWVRGLLPLVSMQEDVRICSEKHRRAANCYRLLLRADTAIKRKDIDACVEYRKKLKAEAPGLYDEYFALLSG